MFNFIAIKLINREFWKVQASSISVTYSLANRLPYNFIETFHIIYICIIHKSVSGIILHIQFGNLPFSLNMATFLHQ